MEAYADSGDSSAPFLETASSHLVTHVPRAKPGDAVAEVIEMLRARRFEALEAVYVTDEAGTLRGYVRLGDLLAAPPHATGMAVFLPWLLARSGLDPAFAAGPVSTVVQDVASIVIYFGVVSVLV